MCDSSIVGPFWCSSSIVRAFVCRYSSIVWGVDLLDYVTVLIGCFWLARSLFTSIGRSAVIALIYSVAHVYLFFGGGRMSYGRQMSYCSSSSVGRVNCLVICVVLLVICLDWSVTCRHHSADQSAPQVFGTTVPLQHIYIVRFAVSPFLKQMLHHWMCDNVWLLACVTVTR